MKTTIGRFVVALITAGAGAGLIPAPAAYAGQSCPIGQHEDTQAPGFQCVPGWCPAGTLLDATTGSCVAPPGVPPPPLR